MMLTLIHFTGCIWGIVGGLRQFDIFINWIREVNIQDESAFMRYITSTYWAVITVNTIGYGDIHPYNSVEVLFNIILVWFGVSMQSYIMSRVTTIFNSTKPLASY
jgi:hypothetical protein